jgi:hypothetical protein
VRTYKHSEVHLSEFVIVFFGGLPYRTVERQVKEKPSLKVWLFSLYVPASSFCQYHYQFSCWNIFPITEGTSPAGTSETEGKNLVWFGKTERKLAKLSMATILPLNYFMGSPFLPDEHPHLPHPLEAHPLPPQG